MALMPAVLGVTGPRPDLNSALENVPPAIGLGSAKPLADAMPAFGLLCDPCSTEARCCHPVVPSGYDLGRKRLRTRCLHRDPLGDPLFLAVNPYQGEVGRRKLLARARHRQPELSSLLTRRWSKADSNSGSH